MIPLKDDNPTRRFPWVTVLLILANAAVFFHEVTLSDEAFVRFVQDWAVVPARLLADPTSPAQLATVVAAMFMHGGWLHILGNMLYLWIFGNNIEDRLGPLGFVAFYLACGVAATAAQIAADPGSSIPMLGASGAVAGVLGAYLVLYPGAAVLTAIPIFIFIELARLPAFLVIGFWFVLQLGSGLASLDPMTSSAGGVAWFAHIGGFLLGVAVAIPVRAAGLGRKRYQGRRAY